MKGSVSVFCAGTEPQPSGNGPCDLLAYVRGSDSGILKGMLDAELHLALEPAVELRVLFAGHEGADRKKL